MSVRATLFRGGVRFGTWKASSDRGAKRRASLQAAEAVMVEDESGDPRYYIKHRPSGTWYRAGQQAFEAWQRGLPT